MKTSFFSKIVSPLANLFDFNQAHLSGCMDIIVIKQKSGDYLSTPFHVRFGTFKVLKVKDIIVEIEINDEKVPFCMHLAEDGHAYFLKADHHGQESKSKPSLRLNSETLKKFGLKLGENKIVYSVYTEYQGKQTLEGRIFLWEYNAKIVFSDVDGTVTKSDVMGHVMTVFKKDWTHEGIAKLYSRFEMLGYKIVYITARPASQYLYTLNYLKRVNQDGYQLPLGPIIMSPDFLLDSAKREVVFKTPEKLKIPILKDIKKLLQDNEKPFIAGFGNRESDAIAFLSIGLEKNQIFIINKKSQIQRLDSPEIHTYSSIEAELFLQNSYKFK